MHEHDAHPIPDDPTADENVGRLLEHAYRPEAPDAEFARRVERLMLETAASPKAGRLHRLRPFAALAAAALLAVGVLGIGSSSGTPVASVPDLPAGVGTHDGTRIAADLMSARPRGEAPALERVAVGDTLRTTAGERRRVGLPDGSVLFVNSNSTVKLSAGRHLSVERGEVYVDVAPDPLSRFRVETPHREVSALGTRFGVKVGEAGLARVVVTHGRVAVSGLGRTLGAGQRFHEREDREAVVDVAPRASHVLDWTRELVAAAESPLVPKNEYGGGALIAIDPWGAEARLTMRKYHVDVHIEDGFARTTIDQTYFNHANWRLEGTFYFPLPADASLSRLAMYVNGRLMEGGMSERRRARNVYEQIVTRRKDPALLEWLDGTTFKMRVFPLEARQEKRIVLSYTQRLPQLYGESVYRFPAGHSMGVVRDWSFDATVIGRTGVTSDSHDLARGPSTEAGVDRYSASARSYTFDQDVVLRLGQPLVPASGDTRFAQVVHDGHRYLMVRHQPELPVEPERKRRDWVFVFESAGSRDPLLARVQVDVVKTMLAHAEADDRFTVLTAGTRVRPFSDGLLPVTDDGVGEALDFLESAHLVGALDLSRAFRVAGDLLRDADNPFVVHVGGGVATIGERDPAKLARQVPDDATYVGVAVGKQWSRPFMKEAAARSGGLFTQINPDETVSWRAFDLMATLATPRLLDTSVVDDAESARFLVAADSVAHGEEFMAVARLPVGAPLPRRVTLAGRLAGEPWTKTVDVAGVADGAGYLPRTWARLELERLVAGLPEHENAEKGRQEIVDLSMQSYVMSPFTSLLVLENDEMYEQFGIDRGRKDHWAMYPAPERIEVVHEPLTSAPTPADPTARLPQETVLRTILYRMPIRLVYSPYHGGGGGHAANVADILNGAYGVQFRGLSVVYGLADLDDVTNGVWNSATAVAAPMSLLASRSEFGSMSLAGARESIAQPSSGPWLEFTRAGRLDLLGSADESMRGFQRLGFRSNGAKKELSVLVPRTETGAALRDQLGVWMNDSRASMRLPGGAGGSFAPVFEASEEAFLMDADRNGILFGDESAAAGVFFNRLGGLADGKSRAQSLWHGAGAGGGYLQRLLHGQTYQWLTYQRRYVQHQPRYYRDLVAFAPGMNTSLADVHAVLDAEAQGRAIPRGTVDDGARRLVERARAAGWMRVVVPGNRSRPGFAVDFDGTGRFAYERVLRNHLRERVVCDGKTLLHLYPDLGVGARRPYSRHHRSLVRSVAPWLLPSADELARGADVVLVDEQTVEIRPLRLGEAGEDAGEDVVRIRLRFDADGRLLERRVVRGAENETLATVTYGRGGVVVTRNADGDEVGRIERAAERGAAPELEPDTGDLIVLALPYRSRGHVHAQLQLDSKVLNEPTRWTDEAAGQLLGADLAQSYDQAARALLERHIARGDRVRGAYVLLVSSQMHWDPDQEVGFGGSQVKRVVDPAVDLEGTTIGAYLGGVLRFARNPQQDFVLKTQPDGSEATDGARFFRELSRTATHVGRMVNGRWHQQKPDVRKRWRNELLRFSESATPDLAWAVLSASWQSGGGDQEFHRGVARALERFVVEDGGLQYRVRYERALALTQGGRYPEARELFLELHADALESGMLPPIEGHFRNAVNHGGGEQWNDFVRRTARELVKRDERVTAMYFVLQCRWLGQQPVAEEMFHELLGGATDDDRLATELAAIEYLWHMGGNGRALRIVEALLEQAEHADDAGLLQLAGALADRQGQTARGLRYFERMMDARYREVPAVLNLQAVRQEHQQLLARFQQVASAVQALEGPVPQRFVARVVRVADRWRALDEDPTQACNQAAAVLRTLGEHDLAWDYMTTPLGAKPNESTAWSGLAANLAQQGDVELADRAYEIAFDIEQTNAQLLWDRAIMLQQAGRRDRARPLFRQVADNEWQPRFEALKRQAHHYLAR